ncbi:hypothetical protein ADH70_017795 [Blautia pseudococcoides]|uniref:Uncharacterized protein n=1 Tax=Blautia pseudococcoides TaxID=1796616 RepID=A0A1C7IFJ2_9FIRM|nr:hypothetical protein A4V09_19205 [Blautia pseudococcoides]ASU30485.1 hypothetical protein ADH70_017795 [Blautia pseudococcoides]
MQVSLHEMLLKLKTKGFIRIIKVFHCKNAAFYTDPGRSFLPQSHGSCTFIYLARMAADSFSSFSKPYLQVCI